MIKGLLYRTIMRIAHKYHWHYAPPCYPEGDTMLWCHWCGFRQVINKSKHVKIIPDTTENCNEVKAEANTESSSTDKGEA